MKFDSAKWTTDILFRWASLSLDLAGRRLRLPNWPGYGPGCFVLWREEQESVPDARCFRQSASPSCSGVRTVFFLDQPWLFRLSRP